MAERQARERLEVIDGLRGIAVSMVFLYHLWLVDGTALRASFFGRTLSVQFLAVTGWLGVEVFFFLSGFCLFYPYAVARAAGRQGPSLPEYLWKRALKIVPSYVLALTAFALLRHELDSATGLAYYLAHLLFVHPLLPGAFQAISGPLWTIGIEVEFYTVFPLICWAMMRRPVPAALAAVAAAWTYRHLLPAGDAQTFYFVNQLPAFVDFFALGMLGAYVYVCAQTSGVGGRVRALATGASVAAIGASLQLLWSLARDPAMQTEAGFFAWQDAHRLAVASLLLCVTVLSALSTGRWRSAIGNRVFVFLSVISYNLYLWHLEILVWFQRTFADAMVRDGLAVIAAFAVSIAVTYVVERPLLRRPMPALLRRLVVVRNAPAA